MKAPQTNVEKITHMMEFSNYGAMSQMFIMEAVWRYAEAVARTPVEEVREQFGENSFINPDAWHGVATEILHKLEAN